MSDPSVKPREPLELAVVQMAMDPDRSVNLGRVGELVAAAAASGAKLVLLPELFAGPYFPQHEDPALRALARPVEAAEEVQTLRLLARTHGVVIPVSFYEQDGAARYNSVAMLDADGSLLGVYRKTHIPHGPGYEETFYFDDGDTGFMVFNTAVGKLGVGICWDQWFPECARAMALMGAELLLYPTAIGSEPEDDQLDTRDAWQRVMAGHAVANTVPVAAANRTGVEGGLRFYGSSFVVGPDGEPLCTAERDRPEILRTRIDLSACNNRRHWFGLLQDRKPGRYDKLTEN